MEYEIKTALRSDKKKQWEEHCVWQGRKIVHRAEYHWQASEWILQQIEAAEEYNTAMQLAMAHSLLDTLTEGIDPTSAGHWVEVCNKFIHNHKLIEANQMTYKEVLLLIDSAKAHVESLASGGMTSDLDQAEIALTKALSGVRSLRPPICLNCGGRGTIEIFKDCTECDGTGRSK